MTLDSPGSIRLLQVLVLLLGQLLPFHAQRLVHAIHAREADDRRADLLVDPRQRHMAHLPALLLRQLLHALDDLLVRLGLACIEHGVVLLAFRASGAAEL